MLKKTLLKNLKFKVIFGLSGSLPNNFAGKMGFKIVAKTIFTVNGKHWASFGLVMLLKASHTNREDTRYEKLFWDFWGCKFVSPRGDITFSRERLNIKGWLRTMNGGFATCRNTNADREVNCIFQKPRKIFTLSVGGIYIDLDQICVL